KTRAKAECGTWMVCTLSDSKEDCSRQDVNSEYSYLKKSFCNWSKHHDGGSNIFLRKMFSCLATDPDCITWGSWTPKLLKFPSK
ncbi:hypothetical protein C2S51_022304, partial [Perilla frutescens var. frutescens]